MTTVDYQYVLNYLKIKEVVFLPVAEKNDDIVYVWLILTERQSCYVELLWNNRTSPELCVTFGKTTIREFESFCDNWLKDCIPSLKPF